MKKKIVLATIFLAVFGFMFNFSAPDVKAMTAAEIQAMIQQIQQQIAQLQQQLAQIEGEEEVWCHDFNVNLRIGDSGSEVVALQTALTKEGATSWEYKGYDGIFDEMTASEVVGFQEKYKEDVLGSWGLAHGTGFVGSTTRAKLNELYGCKEEIKPYIKVTSPNGGEQWVVGETYDIIWKSSGIDKVEILLRDYSVQPVKQWLIAIDISAETGKYTWEAGTPVGFETKDIEAGGKFKIAIREALGEVPIIGYEIPIDESDNYFSIVPEDCHTSDLWSWDYCSADCQCEAGEGDCDSDVDCATGYCAMNVGTDYGQVSSMDVCEEKEVAPSITVISPNGGEKWLEGNTYQIQWTHKGLKEEYVIICLEGIDKNGNRVLAKDAWRSSSCAFSDYGVASYLIANGEYGGVPVDQEKFSLEIPNNISDRFETPPVGYRISLIVLAGDEAGSSQWEGRLAWDESDGSFSIVSGDCHTSDLWSWDYCSADCQCEAGEGDCDSDVDCATGYCAMNVGTDYGQVSSMDVCEEKKEKSITVISPNGGETWVIGKTHTIKWNSTGVDKVKIYLGNFDSGIECINLCSLPPGYGEVCCDPCGYKVIADNVPTSSGEYSWTIPTSQVAITKAKIAIQSTAANGCPLDYGDNYFSIVAAGTNLPPVIDGLSAPTQLKVNETGTWTIKAYDPENGTLAYAVRWGDEVSLLITEQKAFSAGTGQTTTFTHSYSKTGKYTINFTVTDDHQQTAKTSTTVNVVEKITCTDSDGGRDYYAKGTAKGLYNASDQGGWIWGENPNKTSGRRDLRLDYNIIYDSCLDSETSNQLNEGYCKPDGFLSSFGYTCPYGCQDGACQKVGESITVISPNGGEEWVIGETHEIKWETSGFTTDEQTTISLKNEKTNVGTFIASTNNSGSYSWFISPEFQEGDVWKIKVSVGGKYDKSDNCFEIIPAAEKSITVLSPNGGEKWGIGNTYYITWKSSGIEKVDISLCGQIPIDSPGNCLPVIAEDISADLSKYFWTIPSDISLRDDYRIRIFDDKTNLQDDTDGYFSIVSPTPSCTDSDGGKNYYVKGSISTCMETCIGNICESVCTLPIDDYCKDSTYLNEYYCDSNNKIASVTYNCPYGCQDGACKPGITVTSPNGGEKWERGKKYDIFWESTNITSDYKIRVSAIDYSGSTPVEYDLVYNLAGNLGAYSWSIPSNFSLSSKYKVKVEACKGGICYNDTSDNYFSIVSGSLGLEVIENQLASLAEAVSKLMEQVKNLVER